VNKGGDDSSGGDSGGGGGDGGGVEYSAGITDVVYSFRVCLVSSECRSACHFSMQLLYMVAGQPRQSCLMIYDYMKHLSYLVSSA
jgi:hypothetical protein